MVSFFVFYQVRLKEGGDFLNLTRFWSGLAIIYSVFIIYGTLFPFAFISEVTSKNNFALFPLLSVFARGGFAGFGDMISNLIFFIPLGFFLAKVLGVAVRRGNFHHQSFPTPYSKVILIVALMSGLLSMFVEYLQLYTVNRSTSWLDILCNLISGVIGVILAYNIIIPNALRQLNMRGILYTRWFIPSLSALGIVVLESLQPFNFSLGKNLMIEKAPLIWQDPTGLAGFSAMSLIRYGLVFLVATAILCAWLYELSWRRPWFWASGFYLITGVILEAMQMVVVSRIPGWIEVLFITGGCLLGPLLFKYIPQKINLLALVFWGGAGVVIAALFSNSIPGNHDIFKISQLNAFGIYSPFAYRVSMMLSHLSLFFFIGVLVPYLFL